MIPVGNAVRLVNARAFCHKTPSAALTLLTRKVLLGVRDCCRWARGPEKLLSRVCSPKEVSLVDPGGSGCVTL